MSDWIYLKLVKKRSFYDQAVSNIFKSLIVKVGVDMRITKLRTYVLYTHIFRF